MRITCGGGGGGKKLPMGKSEPDNPGFPPWLSHLLAT